MALLAPLAEADPDNLVVAQYLAWLVAKQKGPAAAADLYSALALKLPGDAATQFNAGLCLDAANRTGEALVALKAWKALAWTKAGSACRPWRRSSTIPNRPRAPQPG